jgi:hypothetical protein
VCYRPWSGSAEAEPFDGGHQGTQDATGMPGCLRGCGLDRARQFRPHSAGPKVTALRASLHHHHVCCFLRPAATALRFLRMQSRLAVTATALRLLRMQSRLAVTATALRLLRTQSRRAVTATALRLLLCPRNAMRYAIR